MLKENDKIKVHFYDYNYSDHREIKTRIFNKIFRVYENGGKLGFDYNTERSQYTCKGEIFTQFETFASTVIFENIETGENYHFSNINGLEKIS